MSTIIPHSARNCGKPFAFKADRRFDADNEEDVEFWAARIRTKRGAYVRNPTFEELANVPMNPLTPDDVLKNLKTFQDLCRAGRSTPLTPSLPILSSHPTL